MDIVQSSTGYIIVSAQSHKAFVPHQLPPYFMWEPALITSLSKADFLLGKLSQQITHVNTCNLISNLIITQEAIASYAINAHQVSLSEILIAQVELCIDEQYQRVLSVQNYINILKQVQPRPLSLQSIKELYAQLMQRTNCPDIAIHTFRSNQIWIGGQTIDSARFVPPPTDYLMSCMSQLENFFSNKQFPALIHNALCHYQFETIHPFEQANGRMGRLIINLQLVEQKILPAPLLCLSSFFKTTADEYYQQLYSVSKDGTWNQWLMYFLRGVALQAQHISLCIEHSITLINQYKNRMSSPSDSGALNALDCLVVNPYCTVNSIAQQLGVAYTTAQRAIEKLQAAKILQQTNKSKRDKVYCAHELLAIVQQPLKLVK